MTAPPTLIRTGPRNAITDVAGLLVGQAEDAGQMTGVSVVLFAEPAVAGVDVRGGAPGTRETDLLAPDATVQGVDALVLSGGSAFGLSAMDGVMRWLVARGRGYPVGASRVPIVPGAILFDLNVGEKPWRDGSAPAPHAEMGRLACIASGFDVAQGRVGAAAGARTAQGWGGMGTASMALPDGTHVGALVAVNAHGSVRASADGAFWAAPFEIGAEFGGLGAPPPLAALDPDVKGAWVPEGGGANTTIAIVATDARLTKPQATRLATMAQDGIARAILPAHAPQDGDTVFAAATGQRPLGEDANAFTRLGHAGAACLSRAIARAVWTSAAETET
ncbi:MAG: P1 family peptidase [Pseudomonadota bacterium]